MAALLRAGDPGTARYGRRPWIDWTLDLFRERGGRVVVEIGGIRTRGNYDGDGYSTVAWAGAAAEVFSVDIDPQAVTLTAMETAGFGTVRAVCQDGVKFLTEFDRSIDLLYLDGWDVGTRGYKERHRDAYLAARRNLHADSLVLIDDTDLDGLGKGELVIEAAARDGFDVVFGGKQTLLSRTRPGGNNHPSTLRTRPGE